MTPQPGQPDQPSYLVSELNLFPVYASRAIYQQSTGQQAPPFNLALPIKKWADPNPTGQPYLYFDSANAASGYVSQFTLPSSQAASLNLPGTYTYPAYVSPPTGAQIYGPAGLVGAVNPDQICLLADAQEIFAEILPLLPGLNLTVSLLNLGPFYYVYGQEQRRPWTILPPSGWTASGTQLNCQTLIESKNSHGVGAPGHWTLLNGCPKWVYDAPATQAPPGRSSAPTPMRPLLANERIANIPSGNPLFNPAGTWVVERTDMPQPQALETNDQQFADIKSMLQRLLTKVGA